MSSARFRGPLPIHSSRPSASALTRRGAGIKSARTHSFAIHAAPLPCLGDTFTVADAYLFTVLRWSDRVKLDLSPYKNVTAYMARVQARPKVREAMKAEGLIQ